MLIERMYAKPSVESRIESPEVLKISEEKFFSPIQEEDYMRSLSKMDMTDFEDGCFSGATSSNGAINLAAWHRVGHVVVNPCGYDYRVAASSSQQPQKEVFIFHSPPPMVPEHLRNHHHHHQGKGIKKITTEDVLKKFLDSKMKSPTESERHSKISSAESMRNKNILHGVHVPPKVMPHSLRKKENAQFRYTTISKSSPPSLSLKGQQSMGNLR